MIGAEVDERGAGLFVDSVVHSPPMADREQPVKIIRVVGNTRQEVEISAARARELGIRRDRRRRPSVAYLLDGILAWHRGGERTGDGCPRCGTTQREIILYRRTGCPHCYEAFHGTVERILRLDRTSPAHQGRVPKRLDRYRRLFVEREHLLNRLSHAVEAENFEDAAELRDQLRGLEQDDVEA